MRQRPGCAVMEEYAVLYSRAGKRILERAGFVDVRQSATPRLFASGEGFLQK